MGENSFIARQVKNSAGAKGEKIFSSSAAPGVHCNYNESLLPVPIQRKLTVGAVDDPLEHEADAMADKVMRMPEQNFIQRKCAHCEEDEKAQRKPFSFIQKKSNEARTVAGENVNSQVNASRGTGRSMDSSTLNFMQARFGTDFSNVSIHTGNEAASLSRQLHAKAFTVGSDIYFNDGEYEPSSTSGKHLLAHELTHVIQQKSSDDAQRKIRRRTIKDGFIKYETAPKYLTNDDSDGKLAVELLMSIDRYKKLVADLTTAFKGTYGKLFGAIPEVTVWQMQTMQKMPKCGNDFLGCCQNCEQNCYQSGVAFPDPFNIYAFLSTVGDTGVKPKGFKVGLPNNGVVATASTMFHELLHLWFYQFLCVHQNKQRPFASGHEDASKDEYDPDFVRMWQEAQTQIEAAFNALPPPPAPAAPPKKETMPAKDLDSGQPIKKTEATTEGGKFLSSAGGGVLMEGLGENQTAVYSPLTFAGLGYQLGHDRASSTRWSLAARGFLTPGQLVYGGGLNLESKLLQPDDTSHGLADKSLPAEDPLFFDIRAGVLYKLDKREDAVSSPGVSGGIGIGKTWKLGGVELSVGADADLLYQWKLNHPAALVFSGSLTIGI